MRCPYCGSPVPEGSKICFDCGKTVSAGEKAPWEEDIRESDRKIIGGERRLNRDQQKQAVHEWFHERESTSESSESDYGRTHHGAAGGRPAMKPAPAAAKVTPVAVKKPATGTAAPQKLKNQEQKKPKNGGYGSGGGVKAVIGIVAFLLLLSLDKCGASDGCAVFTRILSGLFLLP